MQIEKYLKKQAQLIDGYLDKFLPDSSRHPEIIHKAMRYSVFSGGKRIRPILAIEASRVCGGRLSDIMPVACAIELIHTYSLIHDDLPSIDDDDYRRGKPSLHKKFDEAIAILAGDALLTLSFELMAKNKKSSTKERVIEDISKAIGTFGMIGGQVVDIRSKNKASEIKYIHKHKTASLIAVSARSGAITSGVANSKVERLAKFGTYLGLSFQIIDDILDKGDYVKLFGEAKARRDATVMIKKAKNTLKPFSKKADKLNQIADFVLAREE